MIARGGPGGRRGGGSPADLGQVFFSILVEFWLTDADEPMPLPPQTALQSGKVDRASKDALDRATLPTR